MKKLLELIAFVGFLFIMLSSCEGMPIWKNIACAMIGFPMVIIPVKKLGWLQ